MKPFVMPTLGADMEAGTLVAWHKQPGDPVHRGDTIAEVDTDKGVIDVEIFSDGVLDEILVPPGRKVRVGTVMATIREAGESSGSGAGVAEVARPAEPTGHAGPILPVETGEERPTPAVLAPAGVAPSVRVAAPVLPVYGPGLAAAGRLRISPAARRLARERQVDPAMIPGTGRGGAVTLADIERAATKPVAAAAPPPPAVSVGEPLPPGISADRLQRMRQTIAAAMARSKREIPHYYLATTIDLHRASSWLAAENETRSPEKRLLPGVLLLKAVGVALRHVPELNAVWEGGKVVLRETVHVGVAISLRQGGLVILALHDTATRSLDSLMDGLRDLTAGARAGRMKSSELSDSTITVTSLGDRGVESVFGVIYPPQVAIVGFGKIAERPWAVDGGLFARPVVTATLAADHRVSDGHRGGLFLDAVDRLLQEPEKL
jgi:pyruvate dehydrogenase E2 component (dihydrolipoamide acetyltransferase)